jgi:hypothetical protein
MPFLWVGYHHKNNQFLPLPTLGQIFVDANACT